MNYIISIVDTEYDVNRIPIGNMDTIVNISDIITYDSVKFKIDSIEHCLDSGRHYINIYLKDPNTIIYNSFCLSFYRKVCAIYLYSIIKYNIEAGVILDKEYDKLFTQYSYEDNQKIYDSIIGYIIDKPTTYNIKVLEKIIKQYFILIGDGTDVITHSSTILKSIHSSKILNSISECTPEFIKELFDSYSNIIKPQLSIDNKTKIESKYQILKLL